MLCPKGFGAFVPIKPEGPGYAWFPFINTGRAAYGEMTRRVMEPQPERCLICLVVLALRSTYKEQGFWVQMKLYIYTWPLTLA